MVWGVAWHFLSDQKPEDHPFVSLREREYIIAHRANMENSDEGVSGFLYSSYGFVLLCGVIHKHRGQIKL